MPYDPTAAFPIGAAAGWRADPIQGNLERYWDGLHWTDQTRPREDAYAAFERARAAAVPDERAGSGLLGLAAQGMLGLTSVWAAALLLYTIVVFNALSVWRLQPTPANEAELDRFLIMSTLANWLDLGLRVVTGVLFLVWLGVRSTDTRVDPRLLRRSPTMTILCWFIPIVSLWWPAQAVKDLWHASRPNAHRGSAHPASLPTPFVFYVWWPAWLCAGSGSTVAMSVFAEPQFDSIYLVWATALTGIQQVATLVAAWALIIVITQVEDHLVARDEGPVFS